MKYAKIIASLLAVICLLMVFYGAIGLSSNKSVPLSIASVILGLILLAVIVFMYRRNFGETVNRIETIATQLYTKYNTDYLSEAAGIFSSYKMEVKKLRRTKQFERVKYIRKVHILFMFGTPQIPKN